jgi:mRNA-degrading endonuclease RelE of RelBE toxin-antitoxin system
LETIKISMNTITLIDPMKKSVGQVGRVTVVLPHVLLEGVDNVAAAEFSDRSAIIRSAVKSYLQDYVGEELTAEDVAELKTRAAQRTSGWVLLIHPHAERELESLGAKDRKLVDRAILSLAANPLEGDVKWLKGDASPRLRKRAGRWRIFFDLEQAQRSVLILSIKARTSGTY